eukprot:scaffold1353_cov161-Amphora_coffeaeformis.AAC.41
MVGRPQTPQQRRRRPFTTTTSKFHVAVEPKTDVALMSDEDWADDDDDDSFDQGDDASCFLFDRLVELLSPEQADLVQLNESSDGVRGVYTTQDVAADDAIFVIPLEACLRDDDIPVWMGEEAFDDVDDEEDGEDDTNFEPNSFTASSWAKRLAGSLLDLQMDVLQGGADTISEPADLWLRLLPEPSQLRATLPIHWSEDILEAAHCTALELAVDSAYFTRAQAVADLMQALERRTTEEPLRSNYSNRTPDHWHILAENALDVVQTRTCRVVSPEDGTPLRILAPLFDMLNHDNRPNAAFAVERIETDDDDDEGFYDALVVRAIQDIPADSEVFISYGASTKPSWRCLASYGFVPPYSPEEEEYQDGDEDMTHSAEVFLQGMRYEVGPGSVSQELVDAMAECMDPTVQRPALLTTQVALRLAQRISEAAYQMLLDYTGKALDTQVNTNNNIDDLDDESDWSLAHVISARQAAALRWNQHRILMSCSLGLRDWAANQK